MKSFFIASVLVFIAFLSLGEVRGYSIMKLDCSHAPNEEYQCGSACQTECATLGEWCPIVNIRCNDRCYCKEGYARDANGLCIEVEKCPPKKSAKTK